MASEKKLWLIRQNTVLNAGQYYCIVQHRRQPQLDLNGNLGAAFRRRGSFVTSECAKQFEKFTDTTLKPGECIEITGFKVLLPKRKRKESRP